MADKKVTVVLSAKDEASKVLNKLGSTLKTTVVAGAAAATAGLVALTVALKKLSEAAVEQVEVDIRLEQAIKNAGLAIDTVLPKLKAHQSGLQRITKFGDETTSTIQSLLISLGGLRDTSAIERATEATLDFASATGVEVKAAGLLFAKAAQGEVSALSRYGLILDQSIPKTEKFGALLELTEKQFGGVARAIGQRLPGQMAGFRNDLGDSIQALGQAIFETKGYTSANETLRDSIRSLTDLINTNKDSIGEWVTGITESVRATINWTIEHKKLIKTIGETAVILGTIAVVKSLAASMAVLTTATIVSAKATIEGTKAIIAYGSAQGFLNAKFAGATPLIKSVALSLGGFAKILGGAVLIAAAAVAVKIALMTREMNKLQEAARQKEIESFSQELQGIRGSAAAYIDSGASIVKATERIRAVMRSTGATFQRDFSERFEAALAIETIQKKFGDDAQKIIDAAKRMSEDGVVSFDRLNAAVLLFEERQGNLAPAVEAVIEPTKKATAANIDLLTVLEALGAIIPVFPGPSKEDIEQTRKAIEAQKSALQEIQQLNFEASESKRAILERDLEFQLEMFEKQLEFEGINTEERLALKEFEAERRKEIDLEVDEHNRELALENLNFGQELAIESVGTLTEGLATFIEHAILNAEDLKAVGEGVMRSLVGSVVGGLAKIASQFLVNAILNRVAKKQEGASTLSANLAGVFSGAFASTAAIPIIGPALAPGVASAALTAATVGSTAAAAIGAGVGSGLVAQEGGFVPMLPGANANQDSVLAMLQPGELIVPTPFAQEFGRAQGFQEGGVVGAEPGAAPAAGGAMQMMLNFVGVDPAQMVPIADALSEAVERFDARLVSSEVAA